MVLKYSNQYPATLFGIRAHSNGPFPRRWAAKGGSTARPKENKTHARTEQGKTWFCSRKFGFFRHPGNSKASEVEGIYTYHIDYICILRNANTTTTPIVPVFFLYIGSLFHPLFPLPRVSQPASPVWCESERWFSPPSIGLLWLPASEPHQWKV